MFMPHFIGGGYCMIFFSLSGKQYLSVCQLITKRSLYITLGFPVTARILIVLERLFYMLLEPRVLLLDRACFSTQMHFGIAYFILKRFSLRKVYIFSYKKNSCRLYKLVEFFHFK